MSALSIEIAGLIDILPADDQLFTYEFIKKLVLAWDPNFTKVTLTEAESIKKAEESGCIPENEIDWDKIGVARTPFVKGNNDFGQKNIPQPCGNKCLFNFGTKSPELLHRWSPLRAELARSRYLIY
jgi:hypothetical protein